jgi:hypothetical protein
MLWILPASLGPGNRNEYQRQNYKMFLGSRAQPVCEADNLTAFCESIFWMMWDPQHHNPVGLLGLLRG